MLREIQEPGRETVSESETPTEPRLRAVFPISSADDSRCVAVQEALAFHSVPTVASTQQAGNHQADSRFLQNFESKEACSMIYTLSSTDVLLQRLEEASMIYDRYVSLLVHDEHGWHELFLNQRGTKTHRITASYLRDIVDNNDLDLWMERNSICAQGDDDHEIGEIVGYQLVVYNQD